MEGGRERVGRVGGREGWRVAGRGECREGEGGWE